MPTRHFLRGLAASTLLLVSSPLFAAIQLTPVVTSGLSSPLFVGNAGDGSNRLFIVEQGGIIKVLQPGASTPTVFLDIQTKVVAGGEQGLLGLAFHPQYQLNRRFFVYYTRTGDGTLIIAEYTTSTNNPNLADPLSERVFLMIAHPTNTNHNGGMLAFGPDNYLYIGVGDGGSANDPPNNAQNINQLLGKILRINVDQPTSPNFYSSPAGNPFVNAPGADEIFAWGFRNPWRFSFDRLTGQQWVGDVGQDAREEVDTPIISGNYGWRIFEGTQCTNLGPDPCIAGNYISPILEYPHSGGRCSITGGYVYRGSQGTLASGTYVLGDYCSGEIFTWGGNTPGIALDTAFNISSFGEDEQGEIYVVNLGGTISKIVSTASCTYSIAPTQQTFAAAGGTASVTVTAGQGCTWTAVSNASWIMITGGATGTGNGTVSYFVAPYTGRPHNRNGTMTIAGLTFSVKQSR